MVFIVFGLPGSGKSFFAERLAEKMDGVYLSSDRIRRNMYKVRTYSEKEKKSVYRKLLTEAKCASHEGKNVVIDGTFYKQEIREQFTEELQDKPIVFIEIIADEQLIRERLAHPRPYSEADMTVYHGMKQQWEPMTEKHLVLSSSNNNIHEMITKAIDYSQLTDDKR